VSITFYFYFIQGKHRVVLDEVSSSSPPEVQPVRMLADYHQNPSKRYVHVMCIISHLLSLSHLETAVILLQHCSKESYVYYIYLYQQPA